MSLIYRLCPMSLICPKRRRYSACAYGRCYPHFDECEDLFGTLEKVFVL